MALMTDHFKTAHALYNYLCFPMWFNQDLPRLALTCCKAYLSVFFDDHIKQWLCSRYIWPRSLKRLLSKHEHKKLLGMHPHKRHFKPTMPTNYNLKSCCFYCSWFVSIECIEEVNCYETGPFFYSDIVGKPFPPKYITDPVQFCYFI